ncbi:MAG: F0F1 ATP synthase subunit gamma, partial [Rhodospirillaceae bacterium]
MASLRDIRKHISSVKSIKQITYAMKMVAAARIKKAQGAILASRPFAQQMDRLVADLYCELGEDDL